MPTSVMPKGVEHLGSRPSEPPPLAMPTSVMPKGVEHITERLLPTPSPNANLCDAERR